MVTVIVTIALAFTGYIATYLNDLRLTKRKERLELINKRINQFYGPLYIALQAGRTNYETLLKKLKRNAVFDDEPPPNEEQLKEWRIWSVCVFMPLNELMEKLIMENAYLIREEEMPECIHNFVTHVSAYKTILKKWQENDFSENRSIIDFPAELSSYVTVSYNALKAEQLKLIGKIK